MARRDTAVTGAAGAYLVAGELSQLGWVASLTWGNAPRTDVLAQRIDPPTVAAIQVKTRTTGSFQVGQKMELPARSGANEWVILVSLIGAGHRPVFYVVPRAHLSAIIYVGYRAWLAGEGRGGRARKPTTMRAANDSDIDGYTERWEFLDTPAEQAPCLLPNWFFELQGQVEQDGRPHLQAAT